MLAAHGRRTAPALASRPFPSSSWAAWKRMGQSEAWVVESFTRIRFSGKLEIRDPLLLADVPADDTEAGRSRGIDPLSKHERVMQGLRDDAGSLVDRPRHGDADLVLDERSLSRSGGRPHLNPQLEGVASAGRHLAHAAPDSAPDPLAPDIFLSQDLHQAIAQADPVQKAEGIAKIALSRGVRANEDGERPQTESGVLKPLESSQSHGIDHGVQLPGRHQMPDVRASRSRSSPSRKPGRATARAGATPRAARWLLMFSRMTRSSVPSPASSIRAWSSWRNSVLAEAAGVEVVVNLVDVAGLPEVHQPMDLVDQRRRTAVGVVAHRLPLPLVPGPQLDGAAGALLGFGVGIGLVASLVLLVVPIVR